MQGIFIPLACNGYKSIMNLDSSFSTAASRSPTTTAINWQVRAERLKDELQQVRANMKKASCQFDKQISQLESAIRYIRIRKMLCLSPLENKEQDLVDELRRTYGFCRNRVDRRQFSSSFNRFESIVSQESQSSLSSIEFEPIQPSIIQQFRDIDIDSEQDQSEDSIEQIEQKSKVLQEKKYGLTMRRQKPAIKYR